MLVSIRITELRTTPPQTTSFPDDRLLSKKTFELVAIRAGVLRLLFILSEITFKRLRFESSHVAGDLIRSVQVQHGQGDVPRVLYPGVVIASV